MSQRMRVSEAKMQSHKTLLDGCCRASWFSARQVPPSDKMPSCFTLTEVSVEVGAGLGKHFLTDLQDIRRDSDTNASYILPCKLEQLKRAQ